MNRLIEKSYKLVLAVLFLFPVLGLVSCSETDDTVKEFADWRQKNEKYIDNLYAVAKQKVDAGDTQWKVIPCWSMPEESDYFKLQAKDCVIVEVLKEGTGSGCPLFTDKVRVHYQGRLIPSVTYTDGYIFDQSFYGTFNSLTSVPSELAVNGVVDGFATALQKMHIGDKWRVHIPYQLGYGEKSQDAIPGYSTLVFEIELVSYFRSDATDVPSYQ